MQTLIWLFLGLAAGAVFIAFTRKLREEVERRVFALALVAAALIYVVFAAMSSEPGWVAVELIGVLVFSALAELGVKRSPLWLMVGWAAHPLWDVGLHLSGVGTEVAPAIYVLTCIGFDMPIAAYIFLMAQQRSVAALRRD